MDDRDIETIVFEALGEVSTCWNPSTASAVFDATRARAVGDQLLTEIRARIVGDRTDELIAERDRLRAALRAVMAETGTSTLAHHYTRDALDGNEEATDG